jgi:acyl-coenzyme A synthetase/AMP-(fatty) acid ligase
VPVFGGLPPGRTVAWCDGLPVSAGQLVTDALALAERLPARGQPVNLCHDRYAFAVGLVATLLRGQTSLMPPNTLPSTLAQLQGDGPPAYALRDARARRAEDGGPDHDPADGRATAPAPLPTVVVDAGSAPGSAPPSGGWPAEPRVAATLPAVCLLTSGSTGPPQPHRKRWDALQMNIAAEADRLAALLGRPDLHGLTIVATVPPQHSYGFESSVLLALLGGAAFDAARPFYPADIVAALERLPRPRALVTTPFHLKTLLRAGLALSPVDLLLSATAPLSPQLAAEAEVATGGRLIEIYGCTEAGQVAARRTTDGEVWTTLGGLTIVRDDEPDTAAERFVVSGGHVLEPTPLADVLELIDGTHFRLLGRANDLIRVAGKRSSLAHLNFHLNRVPGVDDGAFWLPSDDGEGVARTVAFVVAPGRSARQIRDALRQHIEAAFLPRRIVAVSALPREATGKLTAGALDAFARAVLAQGPRSD